MRVFENAGRVNFVDDKNVFVGFDMSQDCCESFGWFITRSKPVADVEPPASEELEGNDFPGFNFDTTFNEGELYPDHDGGGSVTFRLSNDSGEEIFLTLYNHHNGYYGHGWDMRAEGESGKVIGMGCI